MVKLMMSAAAAALLTVAMLPGAANATDSKRLDGLTNGKPQVTDVSARRRHRRVVRRYYRYPRYYSSPYYYGDYYAYAPYPYYRSYYGPRFYGPGFSFGFGW
jgi:hypothetical protein